MCLMKGTEVQTLSVCLAEDYDCSKTSEEPLDVVKILPPPPKKFYRSPCQFTELCYAMPPVQTSHLDHSGGSRGTSVYLNELPSTGCLDLACIGV